jgi:glutamate/tyrosine decarboxylase-like PLP-dependent enzyme
MDGDLRRDPLALTAAQIRELGYRAVDLLAAQLTDPGIPAMRRGDATELAAALSGPAPERPRGWDELLAQLERDVLGPMSRLAHPGYFAFIPASSTFPGALGDLIASALDIDVGSWMSAAGPSQLELVVLDWFKEWIGYPPQAAGILVSGGSAANITALACAREARVGSMSDRVVAYVGDQTHSSVARAARLLGFRPDQLRVLPTDAAHRMRLDALAGAVAADVAAGLQPLVVAANAGATNTGAVDPLPELAAFCAEHGLWLHVDGAYGGFAALSERGRAQLSGIELADSVTLDPHKWLYQPIECGSLLVREGWRLRDAFTINPDYLHDYRGEEVNFADYGLQLTRTARALKIWLSISYFGLEAFRTAIDRAIELAHAAEEQVRASPNLELLSPASLGIICFRRTLPGVADEETRARLNGELVRQFEATGRGLVSSTRLHGTYAIRLCVMNHTSGPDDVAAVLDWFAAAPEPAGRPAPPSPTYEDRRADMRKGWAVDGPFDAATVRAIPLFSALAAPELELVVKSAREVRARAGETVVARWHGSRHLYAILSGRVEVVGDGERLRTMGPGEVFGELAALDWGAGFGYARTATVRAQTEARLFALAPAPLAELCRRAPAIADALREVARRHLAQV